MFIPCSTSHFLTNIFKSLLIIFYNEFWTHLLPNTFPYNLFYLPNLEIIFPLHLSPWSPVCVAPTVLGLRPALVWGQFIRDTLLEKTDSPPSSCQRPTVPQPVVGLCPPCPPPLDRGFLCLELEKLPCMLPQSPSADRCASSLLCWQTVFLISRVSSGSYNISTFLLQRYLGVRGEEVRYDCLLQNAPMSFVPCMLTRLQVVSVLTGIYHQEKVLCLYVPFISLGLAMTTLTRQIKSPGSGGLKSGDFIDKQARN